MKKKLIYYSLYSNKEQDNLIAMAYSEEELKELCLEYNKGVLFEYDVQERKGHLDNLINERLYMGKYNLGEKAKPKKKIKDKKGELTINSKMGDLI